MNNFVRTKSHTGCKFSKKIFGALMHVRIVVVHLYCGFSMRRQMAPQQIAKFRIAFLVNFLPVWGRIALPIMHGFGRCFRYLLEDWICFTTR